MRAKAIVCFLFVCAVFPVVHAAAQGQGQLSTGELPSALASFPAQLRFHHLDQTHGLSQSNVYTVYQDRQGFMWFGTQEGLDRYDGYRFHSYRRVPFDTTSLGPGWVTAILEDRSGTLWIGRTQGLSRLDRETGRFVHYAHHPDDSLSIGGSNIRAMVEDPSGNIWLGTLNRGVSRFDPATGTAVRYLPNESARHGLRAGQVEHLYLDSNGRIWVATFQGLYRYDEQADRFESHLDELAETIDGWTVNFFGQVYEDPAKKGDFWLVAGTGLVRYQPANRRYEVFRADLPTGRVEDRVFTSLTRDPSTTDVLWIHTLDTGLLRFHIPTKRFTRYRNDPRKPGTLATDFAGPLYTDRFGSIWKGSWSAGGIDRFDPAAIAVVTYRNEYDNPSSLDAGPVWGILQDRNGALWVGTSNVGGDAPLSRIDRATGRVRSFAPPGSGLADPAGTVLGMLQDAEGDLWLGTQQGLVRFDPRRTLFETFRHNAADSTSLPHDFVGSVLFDRKGDLWIGTSGGVARMRLEQSGRFTRFVPNSSDPASLSHRFVSSILEDASGMLWFGTGDGLNRMDPALPGVFERHLHDPANPAGLSGGAIYGLAERASEPGVLWIGSVGGGLNRLDTETGEVRHFTEADGLSNNTIYCILDDEDGNLWISTVNGLNRFNPETGHFRVFGVRDGLTHNEFNSSACHKSASGELFFGTIAGVNAFYPQLLGGNSIPPAVVLTEVRLANERVVAGPDSPLQQPLAETEEIRLSHRQRDIAFSFVALHHKDSERNRYVYRLVGYDPDWIDAGESRTATYTNLDPGDYVFRVRAANSDGVWNEVGAAIRIHIAHPIWATVWFRGFALVGLFGLLFGGYRMRMSRVQARNRELESAVAERTAQLAGKNQQLETTLDNLRRTQDQLVQQEKLASLGQLTAGIAHEIKNPLNFVNNFSALTAELVTELREAAAKGEPLDDLIEDIENNALQIEKHGQRADSIVRAMMQHASGGLGERMPTDVNELVREYGGLAYHGMRAAQADFPVELQYVLDPATGEIPLFRAEIGRVLLNLITNAFHAVNGPQSEASAGERPTVVLRTRRTAGGVEIEVEDNGPGMSPEVRRRVFEPFFTTKPTGTGTGLGLSLSHDIVVNGHGGSIELDSGPGKGARFVVRIPAQV